MNKKDFSFTITPKPGTPAADMTEEQLEYLRQELAKIISEEIEKHSQKEEEK